MQWHWCNYLQLVFNVLFDRELRGRSLMVQARQKRPERGMRTERGEGDAKRAKLPGKLQGYRVISLLRSSATKTRAAPLSTTAVSA